MTKTKTSIVYQIDLNHFKAHFFNVSIVLEQALKHQKLSLPVWTPGSYMVREFAQHIVKIEAFENDTKIDVKKINKNTFVLNNNKPNVRINYLVYGFDSSIRAAFIDNQQAFFNGTSVFLRPHEQDHESLLKIIKPTEHETLQWQVATGLTPVDIDHKGFGIYQAKDYDTLVDCPVQISPMQKINFKVKNVHHEMVLVSDVRNFCPKRLQNDLEKLCSAHAEIFGQDLPFDKYVFITRLEEGGFGGLEHKNSSMLLCNPYSMPKNEHDEPDEKYRNFLSLCSHEYFHTYNVKRLKPKELCPYNYEEESYTTLLWVFEGITAYYDDLMVKKAGLISIISYLQVLSKHITTLLKTPGRKMQSLAESSFDTWIKFYRPHENSLNTNVSYYLKGGLVALYIDLSIRLKSDHQRSLDDVMKVCFQVYGDEKGITEDQFFKVINEICQIDTESIKKKFIYGHEELCLAEILDNFGIRMDLYPDESFKSCSKNMFDLGMKLEFKKQVATVLSVEINSPAMKAGLSPHDEIIAVDNIRLEHENFNDLFLSLNYSKPLTLLCSRKKQIFEVKVEAREKPLVYCNLSIKKNITPKEKQALEKWLNGPFSS